MTPSELEEAVVTFVQRPTYQPVKPKVIAKKMGLDEEEARLLRRAVRRLVKRGKLVYGASHRVMRPDQADRGDKPHKPVDSRGHVVGTFRRMTAGHGFVRPSSAPREAGRSEDIYISASDTMDASSGDTVSVQIRQKSRRGRHAIEGRVVEIVQRETNRFVGVYYERGGLGLVRVDGKVFADPISVGDPGAKGVRPDDKVLIEMVRFPSHAHPGEGVLIEVLGQRGTPGVDTLSIIYEFDLPGDFDPEVNDAGRAVAEAFDESIDGDRRDFTADTVITIDPVDARDFDDAVSVRKLDGGHWQLDVHIADVSHFVRPGNPLDREAYERGTSVYLPDRVIPMLPEIISNNLASLQPDRVRYAMTASIEMAADGLPIRCEVFKSAIRSDRRFTYEQVDQYLADPADWKERLSPEVHALLGRMHELAMILRKRRMQRGALELNMPEVKVDLDADGRVVGAHTVEHTESHQIIEEFMLAANEAVARKLSEAERMFLRRVHGRPDPRRLKALTEFVEELGFEVESLESRFAIQELLDKVAGLPQEHAVNYAVLRSMQRAVYSPEEEGHFALASDHYCHFTSPIRRYPDLTVHRLLTDLIGGRAPQQDIDRLYAQGDHCSQREQRATEAERELVKVKLLNYMSTRIGDEMDGVITGVEEFGLFIQCIELPCEGLAHVSSLADDYYHFDRTTHTLEGYRSGNRYRLGDPVRVTVVRADVDRRELDFRVVGRLSEMPKRPPKKKRKKTESTQAKGEKRKRRKSR